MSFLLCVNPDTNHGGEYGEQLTSDIVLKPSRPKGAILSKYREALKGSLVPGLESLVWP
jgi:hypothetical protein